MTKSARLYKDSPSIKKDENGKPGIQKPTQADAEDMGIADSASEMPVNIHQSMSEMLERHSNELKDMQKRHSKEADGIKEKHSPKEESDQGKDE